MIAARTIAAVVAAGVLVSSACNGGEGEGMVAAYCRYGAVSQAQLDGCFEHVTEADVRSRQTHASQYAFGDLDRCLADAGPFCTGRE